MPRLVRLGAVISWASIGGCSFGQPPIDFIIENVSDEACEVVGIDAPEFAYQPIAGIMEGHGLTSSRSSGAVRSAPSPVLVELKGRPWETAAVPPLPPDLDGRIALEVKTAVVERLLQPGGPTFTSFEIADAIAAAADAEHTDIGGLRLLVSRFGAGLSPTARGQALNKARETHTLREGRMLPAGPAIRFLIDEAKFEVNTPLWDSGETLLDLLMQANERDRDRALIEFVNARGGRSGVAKK